MFVCCHQLSCTVINCSHHQKSRLYRMSALFNFESLLSVVLLLICTCTYIRSFAPSLLDRQKTGIIGTFWKMARIGERKSPWVAAACIIMAVNVLFMS